MSSVIGIDVGFSSQYVAKVMPSAAGEEDPTIEIQVNESKGNDFKCKVEYTNLALNVADRCTPSNSGNYQTIADFTTDYLRDTLSVDTERFFSSVSLSKKNGMVYMTFKGKESEKELSVPAAFGLLFLYEHFSVVNVNGASNDWMLTYTGQEDWKNVLQQLKTLYAVPTYFTFADIARLQTVLRCYNLPPSSFVQRSLPAVLSACYPLWKDAYAKDKSTKKTFAVFDFCSTCTNAYLVSVNHNHMKVKCHLHSVEANVRSIELALADAIRKANPEHRKLFRNGDAALHALELARQHLKEFYNGKVEFVRVADEGFVLDGKPVAYDEKVQRKSFLKESKKTKVFEAYEALIRSFVDVLQQYKIVVDRVVPLGDIVNLAEIHTPLLKAFTGNASDKRLSSPANRPDSVAYGTALLEELILTGKAAVDPAFVNTIFWPSPELAAANDATWKVPGTLKITHTHTDVSPPQEVDASALEAFASELEAFVATARAEEGTHAAVREEREKLVEEHQRVMGNLRVARRALEAKIAKEKSEEVEKPAEEKPVEKPTEEKPAEEEKPTEEKPEEKPAEEEKPVEEGKPEEGKPAEEGKSDELHALEMEEGEMEEVMTLIQSDKYMCSGEEAIKNLYQRMKDCDSRLHALVAGLPGVMFEEKEEVVVAPVVEKPKKKKSGCCKGKSDVVPMGPVS